MKKLPDVHLEKDARGIALSRVGVRDLVLPIRVRAGEGKSARLVDTVGAFDLSVSLDAEERGAHLSRLVEAVQGKPRVWDLASLVRICEGLRKSLHARDAQASVSFKYFLEKKAPVSGAPGVVAIEAALSADVSAASVTTSATVSVPVTTLCPCSKAISHAGAHNQRTLVRITADTKGALSLDALIRAAEEAASCEVYAVLKRPDEKYVTERAFSRPRFVEDVVREAALLLKKDKRIAAWSLSAQSQESIHGHDAYAELSSAIS